MSLFGSGEICRDPGCGHPLSEHVKDRIMRDNAWHTVHRCLRCEDEGGSCTDGKSIISVVVPEDETA